MGKWHTPPPRLLLTARSSLTILTSSPYLCRQNDPERSGREVEQYTDDPNDLPSKTPAGLKQAIVPAEDPNLVTWEPPCPFLFYKYGALIRQKSRFAPCMDLKIAEQLEVEKSLVGGTEKA
ncbi:hypothetical protein M378DRAFT_15470 [Amanita muscaria Koide BX008]|uniref:Uncharacterized protein n=1 Tax=Amanita muscaria (strain Koide BX008) TaxID=946122 RepID=A0A0C2SWT2_AMAMK|nr:hypothetical protein M378DRAFT_15470 [Amanita muscaria Koide BX008]